MNKADALRLAASNATVSDKIRALDAAGYPRAEIAKLLGKRYQHVRNVLEGDKLRQVDSPATAGVAEAGSAFRHAEPADVEARGEGVFRLRIRDDGSILLPAEVLLAFGAKPSHGLIARFDGQILQLVSGVTALERIRERLRPHFKEGVSWADELIADRRAEAAREDGNG
jgi:hypothetical protein